MNALTQERNRLNVVLKAVIKHSLQGMVWRVTHEPTRERNLTNVPMMIAVRLSRRREICRNMCARIQVSEQSSNSRSVVVQSSARAWLGFFREGGRVTLYNTPSTYPTVCPLLHCVLLTVKFSSHEQWLIHASGFEHFSSVFASWRQLFEIHWINLYAVDSVNVLPFPLDTVVYPLYDWDPNYKVFLKKSHLRKGLHNVLYQFDCNPCQVSSYSVKYTREHSELLAPFRSDKSVSELCFTFFFQEKGRSRVHSPTVGAPSPHLI